MSENTRPSRLNGNPQQQQTHAKMPQTSPAVASELVRRGWTGGEIVDGALPGKSPANSGSRPTKVQSFAPSTISPPVQPRRTNSLATAGLVCGILAWVCCCCGFPFNLLGLVFSLIALSQINRHPEFNESRGVAITGLILSAVSLVFSLGMLLWSLAFNPQAFQWHFNTF